MKWMGWGYQELLACPISIYEGIIKLMSEEAERRDREAGRIEEK